MHEEEKTDWLPAIRSQRGHGGWRSRKTHEEDKSGGIPQYTLIIFSFIAHFSIRSFSLILKLYSDSSGLFGHGHGTGLGFVTHDIQVHYGLRRGG
jgi:hypothetical protein